MVLRTIRQRHRAVTDRGTAMFLVPAMMLVVIALAAIAVDLVASHAAQRSMFRTASAAADDAAGMIDARRLQRDGALVVDRDAAQRVVRARLDVDDLPGQLLESVVTVQDTTVEVRLRVRVRHIFLDSVPGIDSDTVPIRVRARLDP